jgi:hypothetical protein
MQKILSLIALIIVLLVPAPGQTQEPHRAGLVVQFAAEEVATACVRFTEDEITGVELLTRANLTVYLDYSTGLGAKVCRIGETGCNYPGEDCWCQCQGAPCTYWNYWQMQNGQWVYSSLGAGSRRLSDGDVDGWVWSDGQQPPPPISLDQICQLEAEAAPDTAVFTSPLDTPTASSPISPLPLPSVTAPPPPPPTFTPANRVFIPGASEEPAATQPKLPPSPDRYVGLAGVLAALGLIALTIWRRRQGV